MTPRTSRGSGEQLEIGPHRPIRSGGPSIATHQPQPVLCRRCGHECVIHGATRNTTCGQLGNQSCRPLGAEETGVREVDLDQAPSGLRCQAVRGRQPGEHGKRLESRVTSQALGPVDQRCIRRGMRAMTRLHEGQCRAGVEQTRLGFTFGRQGEAHGHRRRSETPHRKAREGGHRVRQDGRC